MAKWLCKCGFIFDEARGVPAQNIAPETSFESLNEYNCLKCKSDKSSFEEMKLLKKDDGVKVIKATYDRMGEWVMDSKGYFTIKPFKEENLIKVRYYTSDGKLQCVIEGEQAIDIYNTIIREGFVSSLQHAADMGAELTKAEFAMKKGIEYVQDGPLEL